MTVLPVYCIGDFKTGFPGQQFYVNTLSEHLRAHDFITRSHRHDFYILLYFSRGEGTHTIDFHTYPVAPGSVFALMPGQVHSWHLSADAEGKVLFFSKDFYENYFAKKPLPDHALFRSGQPLLHADESLAAQLAVLWQQLQSEAGAPQEDTADMLRDYLDILLLRLDRHARQSLPQRLPDTNWHIRELERLIEAHYLEHLGASQYADMLHLNVKYLNELCRQYLGKTTTRLIHERLLLEARRLLAHIEISINQVAHRLNFDDSSYFSRFFKKMSGQTPEEFRKGLFNHQRD